MINRKTVGKSLNEHLQGDGALLKDFADLAAFTSVLLAGGSLALPAYLILITKTAGASLSAATRIIGRLSDNKSSSNVTNYDKFRALFYVLCQQSYFFALANNQSLAKCATQTAESKNDVSVNPGRIAKTLSEKWAQIDEAEISFHYSVDPSDRRLPLFDCYSNWLSAALSIAISDESVRSKIVRDIHREAKQRLHVELATADETRQWMRNYLALDALSATEDLTTSISEIRNTLAGWKNCSGPHSAANSQRWKDYRALLQTLPTQKDSMYNEDFGVAEVFVPPRIRYHRAGLPENKEMPDEIDGIGRLLGALVSNRLDSSDLIILCGGPGSGKSTLCRVLASELAKDDQMHPAFLRLRRCKESENLSAFIEDYLVSEGAIGKLADLRDLANVVLILDGFDELVLASRTRLRTFFNLLLDDLRTGPFRNAKVIVSGRDTLFPRGDGLPRGSHVLSILPFDSERVALWGERWRLLHQQHATGSTFRPETLIEPKKANSTTPLHQLATWPLTLHLLAKVHTAGLIDLSASPNTRIEKAYLYRSILRETAKRQLDQASGRGRLAPREMRDFLRALAWSMYSRSVDSMSIEDVIPIAKGIVPHSDEAALADLTEVAIVNSPELQKGEETGFEFVHKSFAEYLVAEYIGLAIERVSHKISDIDGNQAWHLALPEAARASAEVLAIRVLPAEVQEMLEPMLGSFVAFSKGEKVDDLIPIDSGNLGLLRVRDRFQYLYAELLKAQPSFDIEDATRSLTPGQSRLDTYANLLIGIVLIGSATARRLQDRIAFQLEPTPGAFWRWMLIIHNGSLPVHRELATRMYDGVCIARNTPIGDFDMPMKLGLLQQVQGYGNSLVELIRAHCESVRNLVEITGVAFILCARRSQDDFDEQFAQQTMGHGYLREEVAKVLDINEAEVLGLVHEAPKSRSGIVNGGKRGGLRVSMPSHFVSHAIDRVRKAERELWMRLSDSGFAPHENSDVSYADERDLEEFRNISKLSVPESESAYEELLSFLCGRPDIQEIRQAVDDLRAGRQPRMKPHRARRSRTRRP